MTVKKSRKIFFWLPTIVSWVFLIIEILFWLMELRFLIDESMVRYGYPLIILYFLCSCVSPLTFWTSLTMSILNIKRNPEKTKFYKYFPLIISCIWHIIFIAGLVFMIIWAIS